MKHFSIILTTCPNSIFVKVTENHWLDLLHNKIVCKKYVFCIPGDSIRTNHVNYPVVVINGHYLRHLFFSVFQTLPVAAHTRKI